MNYTEYIQDLLEIADDALSEIDDLNEFDGRLKDSLTRDIKADSFDKMLDILTNCLEEGGGY